MSRYFLVREPAAASSAAFPLLFRSLKRARALGRSGILVCSRLVDLWPPFAHRPRFVPLRAGSDARLQIEFLGYGEKTRSDSSSDTDELGESARRALPYISRAPVG